MLASVKPKTHLWMIMDGEGNQHLNEKRMQKENESDSNITSLRRRKDQGKKKLTRKGKEEQDQTKFWSIIISKAICSEQIRLNHTSPLENMHKELDITLTSKTQNSRKSFNILGNEERQHSQHEVLIAESSSTGVRFVLLLKFFS